MHDARNSKLLQYNNVVMAVVTLTVGDNTMIVLIISNLKNCYKRRRSPTTVASPFASLYATKNQLTDEFFLVVVNVGVNINVDVNVHDKRDSRSLWFTRDAAVFSRLFSWVDWIDLDRLFYLSYRCI